MASSFAPLDSRPRFNSTRAAIGGDLTALNWLAVSVKEGELVGISQPNIGLAGPAFEALRGLEPTAWLDHWVAAVRAVESEVHGMNTGRQSHVLVGP
jgi:hypothetical protein